MGLAARCIRRRAALQLFVVMALLCVGGAWAIDLGSHLRAGLAPTALAWSATVAMLLSYQGFHLAVLLLMDGYVLVRSGSGRLRPDARATLDNTVLMWHCVTAQGAIGAALVQWLPRLAV
jgi:cytochrome c oxidase subunit I+III